MMVECETSNDSDGCCMFSVYPEMGGWCLFQNGTKLDTYRLTNEFALDFMEAAFYSNQSSYEAAIESLKIDIADANYVDYLDVFHCEASGGVYTCYNYQPNWTDLGESDSYPRFGRLDPVKAAFIESTLEVEATFWDQTLYNSASGLMSAAIAILVITISH